MQAAAGEGVKEMIRESEAQLARAEQAIRSVVGVDARSASG